MNWIDSGGLAFPHPGGANDATVQESHLGMTLRDYIATAAMSSSLNTATIGSMADAPQLFEMAAKMAYMAADAMIKERDKPL